MMLMDMNVLVYAHREDVKNHLLYRAWLESIINSTMAYGFSELVLSGFIRIVTQPKLFEQPSSPQAAIGFAQQIRSGRQAICLAPGRHHWELFVRCLESTSATGNDVADAYHAALAMEWDCDWVTTDKGFRRFKELGLRIRNPVE